MKLTLGIKFSAHVATCFGTFGICLANPSDAEVRAAFDSIVAAPTAPSARENVLARAADADDERLVEQFVHFVHDYMHSGAVPEGGFFPVQEIVVWQSPSVRRALASDLVANWLDPYLRSPKFRDAAELVLSASGVFLVEHDYGELPRFERLASYFEDHPGSPDAKQPVDYIVKRVFQINPDAAVVLIHVANRGTIVRGEEAALFQHVLSTVRVHRVKYASLGGGADSETVTAISAAVESRAWWLRLYALAQMGRDAALLRKDIVERMARDDESVYVREYAGNVIKSPPSGSYLRAVRQAQAEGLLPTPATTQTTEPP